MDLLAGSGRPFFLLIEEEEIDTAAHRRDFERMSRAVDRLDAAVRVATDFAARDGRTLVLLTGDHSTGGPMIDHASSGEQLVVQWESASTPARPCRSSPTVRLRRRSASAASSTTPRCRCGSRLPSESIFLRRRGAQEEEKP
ncbi:MAG: alkaline phosphatase [Thermoanaerobaculia bacterium]